MNPSREDFLAVFNYINPLDIPQCRLICRNAYRAIGLKLKNAISHNGLLKSVMTLSTCDSCRIDHQPSNLVELRRCIMCKDDVCDICDGVGYNCYKCGVYVCTGCNPGRCELCDFDGAEVFEDSNVYRLYSTCFQCGDECPNCQYTTCEKHASICMCGAPICGACLMYCHVCRKKYCGICTTQCNICKSRHCINCDIAHMNKCKQVHSSCNTPNANSILCSGEYMSCRVCNESVCVRHTFRLGYAQQCCTKCYHN